VYVAGLREDIVVSPEQVLDLLKEGEANRHIGATKMNEGSSRSHTVFRMVGIPHWGDITNIGAPALRWRVSQLHFHSYDGRHELEAACCTPLLLHLSSCFAA
jgi:hypothetical protein